MIDLYTAETPNGHKISIMFEETGLDYEVHHIDLAGDLSIADFAAYPWVRTHRLAGVSLDGLPDVSAWLERLGERPAVQRGLDVPVPQDELDDISAEEAEELGTSIVD